jgi:hypothetical protein
MDLELHAKQWRVDVFLSEEGDETFARAVLHGDSPREVFGTGYAHRNPHDPAIPEIGDELAAARALADLAAKLDVVAFADLAPAGRADAIRAGTES